jgi:DNA-binding transcriptional LysR family regulator
MAVDGFGIANVPASMVTEEIHAGNLIEVHYKWKPQPLRFFARYDAGKATPYIKKAVEIAKHLSSSR